MLKLTNYAVTMALLTHIPRANAQEESLVSTCGADGLPISTFKGTCNLANFQAGLSPACNITLLFPPDPATGNSTAEAGIADICEYDAPTQFVEIQGTYQRDRRYFAGGGNLVDGADWALDSARIERFHKNTAGGRNTLIAFPEYLARVDYHTDPAAEADEKGYGPNMNLDTSCDLKTVMCCFTDDSKITGSSFSDNGDATTDVCRHDLHLSPESNHIKEGWSVFPGAEDSPHCVGFTWTDADGADELLGNMMYDVSLGNSIAKGYRNGIPGAPMCGCLEHMPVVEKASCRTAAKTGDVKYEFDYDSETGEISAENTADIEYAACAEPDLADQYKANHKATHADKVGLIDSHLVGEDGCAADITEYLNEVHFVQEGKSPDNRFYGESPDSKVWSDLVIGQGIFFLPPDKNEDVGDAEFRDMIEAGCKEDDGVTTRLCIVRRVCTSCNELSHRDIYYKRKVPLPEAKDAGGVYFLDTFMNKWTSDHNNNMGNGDFELYSTYEDALAGKNKWTYCGYYNHPNHYGYGFPGYCGPTGGIMNQYNSYAHSRGYAKHNGYYVERA